MAHGVWSRNHLIRDAIYRAIEEKMREDESIYLLGEGAHMKVHYDAPSIQREFPKRIITMPISENSNTDFAVGLSLAGLKPVVDVITADFLYRTMDAICNTVAKTNYCDTLRTIVIRAEFMDGGPTTGQRPEALFARIPGLAVVVPSNPADAYGLMLTALERKGATVFFEDRHIDDETTDAEECWPNFYRVAMGMVFVCSGGKRVTVVSYGLTLRRLIVLLDGADVDLLDLRTLYPLDFEAVASSVRRTGALLVVEPDVRFGGIGAEVVATVATLAPGARFSRVGAPRATMPASRALHEHFQPSDKAILDELEWLVKP